MLGSLHMMTNCTHVGISGSVVCPTRSDSISHSNSGLHYMMQLSDSILKVQGKTEQHCGT